MAKSTNTSKKTATLGIKDEKKLLAKKGSKTTKSLTQTELNATVIDGFISNFNPTTSIGNIQISLITGDKVPFNNLAAPAFTAILTTLRSGKAMFNGQFIIAKN